MYLPEQVFRFKNAFVFAIGVLQSEFSPCGQLFTQICNIDNKYFQVKTKVSIFCRMLCKGTNKMFNYLRMPSNKIPFGQRQNFLNFSGEYITKTML